MRFLLKAPLLVFLLLIIAVPSAADWDVGDCHKMHYAQMPDTTGLDVNFRLPHVVADDWKCMETDSVEDVHFWFSVKDDSQFVINNIRLSIHADIPANPNEPGFEYSKPGLRLWHQTFWPGQFTIREYAQGAQGWYSPEDGEYIPNDHQMVYQCNITNIQEPFPQVKGTIYWLAITIDCDRPIGWKSSLDNFNDDAVWAQLPSPLAWDELRYPPGHELEGQSIDLAFVITDMDTIYCASNKKFVEFVTTEPIVPGGRPVLLASVPASMTLRKGPLMAEVNLVSATASWDINSPDVLDQSGIVVTECSGQFEPYMWGSLPIGTSDFSLIWGSGFIDWGTEPVKIKLDLYLEVTAPGFPPFYTHASGLGRLKPGVAGPQQGAPAAGDEVILGPGGTSLELVDATAVKNLPRFGHFKLYQSLPNPFNPTTTIRFDVTEGGAEVSLEVYDVRGRRIRTLVDGFVNEGEKSVVWNGTDHRGNPVSTGMYFYRLRAPGFDETRKMMLLK